MSDDAKEIIGLIGDALRELRNNDVVFVAKGSMSVKEMRYLEDKGFIVSVVDSTDNVFMPREAEEAQATTHVRIETLGCGEITCPVDHITLHMVGGTHRLLIRDDVEWREVSAATYNYIKALLSYA